MILKNLIIFKQEDENGDAEDGDDDDDDDNDDDDNDGDDDYSYNSVNFQVRTSRFCMRLYLNNISYIMMMMMMKMMKKIIALTQSIFKLGPPDFA